MKIAILTGASSGVGVEFFNILKTKNELDEIWIIARRTGRLLELAKKSEIKVVPISLDLTDEKCIKELETMLESQKPDIRVLINNAGFGKLGYVYEIDYSEQMKMVMLNNAALTALCSMCIKYMREGAYIINVASIAAFAPNTRMATYCSTKAYVLSFTKCIRSELKNKKINALAVCPGPMETEFLNVAGIIDGASKTFDTLPYCNPEKVAKNAIKKAEQGRGVYTPRAFYKFYRFLSKILPHQIIMKFSKT